VVFVFLGADQATLRCREDHDAMSRLGITLRRVSRAQRIVLVAGLALVLWQLTTIALPFTPAGSRYLCNPATINAFARPYTLKDPRPANYLSGTAPNCRGAARHRLWSAGVIISLTALGSFAAIRLMRDSAGDLAPST
jgi:hypothetical protein